MSQLKAVRGMRDIMPETSATWQWVEAVIKGQLHSFGYKEIRLPVLEATALFARSAGEATDLVQKEMYSFADRHDGSLSLRPEGTAGCVRALIQNSRLFQPTRLWYGGSMFRYERPQKGRYRQFEQIGVEAVGYAGPDIDAELLVMVFRIWQALGLADDIRLELNTLGTAQARPVYRRALLDFFENYHADLDEEHRARLVANPLRILDSKVPEVKKIVQEAPVLMDFIDDQAKAHFDDLCELLTDLKIPFVVNPLIVRGLDYYTHTVFEWTTEALGAQNAVCSGGRYDDLVAKLGGTPTPAAGFAFGMDRVILLAQEKNNQPSQTVDFYILPLADAQLLSAVKLADEIRSTLPEACVLCHAGGGKVKARLKQADRSGASFALLLGDEEVKNNQVTIKPLRGQGDQSAIARAQAVKWAANNRGNKAETK